MNDPTKAVVEAHAVLGRREGVQLDHRLIVLDQQMFHLELRTLRKYLTQLGEGAGDEGLLAAVMPCERVGAHHGPVDVLSYVFKEGSAVALFKSVKDFANTLGCDSHWTSPWFAVCQLMR